MKIKIKNFNDELPSYLTVGKEYDVHGIDIDDDCYIIYNRDGQELHVLLENCAFLNGGSWEIVDE